MARILLRGAPLAAAAILGSPGLAQAHFNLHDPPNWLVQESDGTPQKMGPCGDPSESQPAAMMSNMVTEYKAGQTIAIKLQEMVTHPGHYRVALSPTGRDGLPADPTVTKSATDTSANGQCGTAEVMDPPMMPILLDNALEHTSKLTGEQTIMVTLPADVECENCTLQVIEFMSNHPAPCFYHHCADIKITNDGGMSAGGMSAGGASAGGTSAGGMSAGGASSGGMNSGGAAGMSTAGSSSVGGATGQGGSAGTGAIVAPGGTSAGGASGTGGSTTPMGGTGNTAMGGTGNTTVGMAGSTAARAGTGTTPPAPAAQDPDAEGGCSLAAGHTSSPLALLALLGLAGLRARRRR